MILDKIPSGLVCKCGKDNFFLLLLKGVWLICVDCNKKTEIEFVINPFEEETMKAVQQKLREAKEEPETKYKKQIRSLTTEKADIPH